MVKKLEICSIRMDGGTQAREGIDRDTVRSFAEAMNGGAMFPPVTLYHDGESNYLTDGFHRVQAALFIDETEIEAKVIQGNHEDAKWASCEANKEHDTAGRRRTNADKRRATSIALELHPEFSDRSIAEHVGVSDRLVNKVRAELTANSSQSPEASTKRVGRDGRTISTSNIGKRVSPNPPPVELPEDYTSDHDETPDGVRERRRSADEFDRNSARAKSIRAIAVLEAIDPKNPAGRAELERVIHWINQRLEQ